MNFGETTRSLVQKEPLRLIDCGFLTAKLKAGGTIRLKKESLSSSQNILLKTIRDLWADNKPARILIPKSRQQYISTMTEAIIFSDISQLSNRNAMILADDIKGSNYLFEMCRFFHQNLMRQLKYELVKSNEKRLQFDKINSNIYIETADNKKAGRKYTLQYVHFSEIAFCDYAKEIMGGLTQSVPDLGRTLIVAESTGNGATGWFYDEVMRANKRNYGGIWKVLFIPFWMHDEYEKNYNREQIEDFLDDEEKDLVGIFEKNLIPQERWYRKLAWRRYAIENLCFCDLDLFHQEYPARLDDCFSSTGRPVFNLKQIHNRLNELSEKEIKPVFVGRVEY
jgi:hypothetical protein